MWFKIYRTDNLCDDDDDDDKYQVSIVQYGRNFRVAVCVRVVLPFIREQFMWYHIEKILLTVYVISNGSVVPNMFYAPTHRKCL